MRSFDYQYKQNRKIYEKKTSCNCYDFQKKKK